ncbi:unnamed protein product [Adineta steineri]|uniref:Major facilitator superfamily (MFS) profile domain-containing protein n=1 Tax=Adineta steineri TaxID=433720 RepID=A0A815RL10_9BILA|nr:unnamed protein product [Adineta steineri]CAF3926144.1 unnamed protein product [Adineta steineri]
MSTRKYRLAAPIDNDKIDISHRSVPHSSPVWLPTSNNVCTKPEKALLHTKPFIPPARWWIVLPLLLLSVFIAAADPVITNDFIVRRYERQYGLDASPNTQRQVCRQSVSTSTAVYYRQYLLYRLELSQRQSDYALVQRAAAKLHTKLSVASLIPGFLSFILLGSNCDTIGRRPLLILPIVGKVIRHSLMLIIVSRDLSDTWLLVANAIEASIGSSGLVLLSSFAYITDCTVGSLRTRAFLITEGTAFLIRVVPVLAIGIWLRFYLYIVPLSVCLGISVIALLYALFVQPESVESV